MDLSETEKSKFHPTWWSLLKLEFDKDYMKKIYQYLISRKIDFTEVCPSLGKIYKAFENDPKDIKIVIIGDEPYNDKSLAQGLAFSVPSTTEKLPLALKNIIKEVEDDVYNGLYLDNDPDLTKWSNQGVFLLNTNLTVEESVSLSHQHLGWGQFTSTVIKLLNNKSTPVVFMLWGNARAYKPLITNKKHLILEADYPSEIHQFKGCKHFSKANEFLRTNNIQQITW